MSAADRHRKELRKEVGFEIKAALCGACRHYRPPNNRIPQAGEGGVRYFPPFCKKHEFVVAANSICDHWLGSDGAGLELP